MYFSQAENLSESFYDLGRALRRQGQPIASRWDRCVELHPVYIHIRNPQERIMLTPGRKNNLAATIYETFWILAGRNDITSAGLGHYLKRAGEFSDDGATWRGGYGPRLRRFGAAAIDQVQAVYNILKKSTESRQAVIGIFDPQDDHEAIVNGTKDTPCNNMLYFLIRGGKLDVTATVRSNDYVWGFSSINVFEWTALQEVMADMLGVGLGDYYHNVNSFHIYQDYYDKCDRWLDLSKVYRRYRPANIPFLVEHGEGMERFQYTLGLFFSAEAASRVFALDPSFDNEHWVKTHIQGMGDCKAAEYARVVAAYNMQHQRPDLAAQLIQGTQSTDLKLAAISQLDRRMSGWAGSYFDQDTAYNATLMN